MTFTKTWEKLNNCAHCQSFSQNNENSDIKMQQKFDRKYSDFENI